MAHRILIIGDDADTRLGLSIRFRANGFATLFAADANGGVMAAQAEVPDLILLDLGSPGEDGFVVLDRLKSSTVTEPIPVIVLSARDPTVNMPRALELGAEAYFQKPAEDDELLAEVRRHLPDTGAVTEASPLDPGPPAGDGLKFWRDWERTQLSAQFPSS